MSENTKAFFTTIKEFIMAKKILSFFMLILLVLSVPGSISSPNINTFLTTILIAIFIIFYGVPIIKYSKVSENIFNHMKEKFEEKNSKTLHKALLSKQVFWYSLIVFGVVSLINVSGVFQENINYYLNITHFASDISFLLCLLFGVQTLEYFQKYIQDSGQNIIESLKSLQNKKGE